MGVKDHSESADREIGPARCYILTVSDTRKPETDESGNAAAGLLSEADTSWRKRWIVPNDRAAISDAARAAVAAGADSRPHPRRHGRVAAGRHRRGAPRPRGQGPARLR